MQKIGKAARTGLRERAGGRPCPPEERAFGVRRRSRPRAGVPQRKFLLRDARGVLDGALGDDLAGGKIFTDF